LEPLAILTAAGGDRPRSALVAASLRVAERIHLRGLNRPFPSFSRAAREVTAMNNNNGWLIAWMIVLALDGVALDATAAEVVPPKTSAAGKPFSIQRQDGNFWLVKPNGERFFSLGVCVVNMGISRAEFDPNNPGYAAWRHYADSNQWAGATRSCPRKRSAPLDFATLFTVSSASPMSSAPTGSNTPTNRHMAATTGRISISDWWIFMTGLTRRSPQLLQRWI